MGTEAPAFRSWLEQFFAFFFRRNPIDATFIGIHDFDHLLPDYSPGAIRMTLDEIAGLQAELSALPEESLTEAERHDRLLADGFLALRRWEYESSHFQFGNPSLYTGEAVFSVLALFHRDDEPVDERVAAAIARMKGVPAFLEQGRRNVASAPLAWTERASRECRAGMAFFGSGIELLANERAIASDALCEAAKTALAGFQEHLGWLETTLRQQTRSDVACGAEAFNRYLRLGHQLRPDQDAEWVETYAVSQLRRAQEALASRAAESDAHRRWQDQLADLADLHPTAERYYAEFGRVWNEAREATIDAELVTWPDFPIEYVPIPVSDRAAAEGLYYLFYRCPAPFGSSETHRYRVSPVEPEMDAEVRAARLRANNDSVIKLNHVVHHGGIGHHVQNWHAFRAESRIAQVAGVDGAARLAMSCAGTLVEGWACYAVDLMESIGFLTPLESLAEAHGRVRMAARAVVDGGIHTGKMTLDEAAAFYERETAMSPAAARAEAVKNSMFPGAAMIYLIGADAIHDLRARLHARRGADFSLRTFHDQFLSYGAIPVSLIAASMLAGSD